ncbi:MAG: calcium/sodium antiporter [Alphaproteobacteria bacterium]
MMYVELLGGLIILMVAAEVMIRGAVGLARLFGLSPLLIGMTVVALGTSAPELVVSLDAALTGNAGIATGNIVGSNIANTLLIVGAAAVISPMARRGDRLYRDGTLLVLCTALFVMLCWGDTLDVAQGGLLLIIFLGFMGSAYWRDINNPKASAERVGEVEEIGAVPQKSWIAWAATLGGLAGIAVGADLMVGGGVAIARSFGLGEEVIGLTLIAIGTSLPELAASAVAARRGHADVAIGNVVGSNMFNMLGIAGVVSMAAPLPVPSSMLAFDLWVMLGVAVLIVPAMIGWTGVSRAGGVALLVLYGGYLAAQVVGLPTTVAGMLF